MIAEKGECVVTDFDGNPVKCRDDVKTLWGSSEVGSTPTLVVGYGGIWGGSASVAFGLFGATRPPDRRLSAGRAGTAPTSRSLKAQPMTSLDKPKIPPCSAGPKTSSIFALMAKVRAVTNSAKQLPIKSRSLL